MESFDMTRRVGKETAYAGSHFGSLAILARLFICSPAKHVRQLRPRSGSRNPHTQKEILQ